MACAALQVGVKASFQGSQGLLTMFFGNKSPHALQRLICSVPPAPQFQFQLGGCPPSLEPKRQVQVGLPCAAHHKAVQRRAIP